MTRLHQIALATIIGLSTPTLVSGVLPAPVMASQAHRLDGVFSDSKWTINISFQRNAYRYQADRIGDKAGIDLAGATIGGTSERRTYTWNNDGTRYQAIWQPKDPDFIRVRVISPRGNEIFNRLLKRQEDCC
jgi:hypothetical protein